MSESIPAAPVAPVSPHRIVQHDEERIDNYHWLREKDSPEVRSYLEAENRYTDAILAGSQTLRDQLSQEMVGRIQEDDTSAAYPMGAFEYFFRTAAGKQYRVYCRRRRNGGAEADEEVLLDLNGMAEGQRFMALSAFEVSDSGELLAYTTDVTGFREYVLRVKNLTTRQHLDLEVQGVGTVAWSAGDTYLFFTREDAAKRPHQLWRVDLSSGEAVLLLEEPDERFRIWVRRSRSGEFLFVGSSSHTADEIGFLRAGEPLGALSIIAPREPEHEYDIDHSGDRFYIRTNSGGRNFRLCSAPVDSYGRDHWREIVPHRPAVMLEALSAFQEHLVLREREDALPHLRVIRLGDGEQHRVQFPEPVYDLMPFPNREFQTDAILVEYTSLTTPPSVFACDLNRHTMTLLKREPVLGGYDPAGYRAERVRVPSEDGTEVPVSIVYKGDLTLDGGRPLYLIGYGSYGFSYPVNFQAGRISLLDRGVVIAIAHIRGGGELGKSWHDRGRMLNKRNTFTDFIAVADYLCRSGYTRADRLAIQGGSAGGLLMGAVLNRRPDLCRAALVLVPFVDVLNTMSDTSLPLTVGEFEEWGNPSVREHYEYMRDYCPYTNLASRSYPAMLVKTSLNDSQVMYWEPAKYVAKLRTLNTGSLPVVLHTNMDGGHGGSSGRYDRLRETAFDYAFLLTQLGVGA
jgi:oligopeptidase B